MSDQARSLQVSSFSWHQKNIPTNSWECYLSVSRFSFPDVSSPLPPAWASTEEAVLTGTEFLLCGFIRENSDKFSFINCVIGDWLFQPGYFVFSLHLATLCFLCAQCCHEDRFLYPVFFSLLQQHTVSVWARVRLSVWRAHLHSPQCSWSLQWKRRHTLWTLSPQGSMSPHPHVAWWMRFYRLCEEKSSSCSPSSLLSSLFSTYGTPSPESCC